MKQLTVAALLLFALAAHDCLAERQQDSFVVEYRPGTRHNVSCVCGHAFLQYAGGGGTVVSLSNGRTPVRFGTRSCWQQAVHQYPRKSLHENKALATHCLKNHAALKCELQVIQNTIQRGCSVLREYPKFNRLVATCPFITAAYNTAESAGQTLSSLVNQQMTALQALEHVAGVQRNGWIQRPKPIADTELAGTLTSAPQTEQGVCGLRDPSNPDAGLGITSEGVPYGITLTQSDVPEMQVTSCCIAFVFLVQNILYYAAAFSGISEWAKSTWSSVFMQP